MVNKTVIVDGIEHLLSSDKIYNLKSTHSDDTSVRNYDIVYDSKLDLNFFVIPKHTPWIDDKILKDKKAIKNIIDYTQRNDNKIVKIYNITEDYIVTEYNEDYYPFIIKSSTNFYDKSTFDKRSGIHSEYFKDRSNAEKFHKDVLDEYYKFNNNTGCYFSDLFPNNILVNDDYSKFKIIDVSSLRMGKMIEKPSLSMIITGDSSNDMGFSNPTLLKSNWKNILFQMHVMWYESEMMNETLDSLEQALKYSKDKVDIKLCLNSQTYLEKPIEGKADDMFKKFLNHPVLENTTLIHKTDKDNFYNIGDWRREQYNEYGYTIWGESDCLMPDDMFYILENLDINHPHTLSFSSRKMFDDTWAEVEFVGLDKYSSPYSPRKISRDDKRPSAPHVLISGKGHDINQNHIDGYNDDQGDVDIILLNNNKVDGSLFVLSNNLPQFIPDDMHFVREDTCASIVFQHNRIPQYHVKNRLKGHNYYHPLKRTNTDASRNDEVWKKYSEKSINAMNEFLEKLQ
tara:strand:+ start:14468 stop:16003 length:1536 start_codon:yes stop_codon:yes gene_type:complete